jgi:glycosyltransferase involved in cell wall biosynthesis
MSAHNIRRDRAEALHGAARYCRIKQKYQLGFDLAKRALKIRSPNDSLFLEEWVYQYGSLDEYAVNAYWIGRYDECLTACDRLLYQGKIPAEMRERVEKNARFAREKLSFKRMESKKYNAKALCLNMIVKNEMANLERCLSSVAPHISCWVIGDTGSTDGTREFIQSFFAARGIPGDLHSFGFDNFEQARNEALDRARASRFHFDYLLLTDADMELTVQNPAFSQNLTVAAYKVLQRSGVAYWNSRLLRRDAPARYRGVTHEFLDIQAGETKNLTDIGFIDHATGSNRASKYERDLRLLRNAITAERDPGMIARYSFYLANTLRDAGQKQAALEAYLERSRLGHWREEVFLSLFNVAGLKEALQYPSDEVITAYMNATASLPTRAEALASAARFCRGKSLYEQGYDFATKGLAVTYPNDGLFVQDWIYEYGLLDEFAVCAYWTARYTDCRDACDRLLTEGKIPVDHRDRILTNKRFALDRLAQA